MKYKKLAAGLMAFGLLAYAGVALADTTGSTGTAAAPTPTEPQVLSVGAGGKVLLRGTIDSVSATSITVKSWGGSWTVNVPTTASVLPQGDSLSNYQQGDFVGVQGTINTGASWTVDATLVRDWTARQALKQEIQTNVQSVHQTVASGPRTIQGALSNLDATAETFTLTTSSGTAYTVTLGSGAKLLAKNWATLDFSKVANGDTVRVYGTVSGSAITASIFRDVSVK